MTDLEKATELGIKYQTQCHEIGDCEFEARQSALEMAEWKEQQMIDKAREWLTDMACIYAYWEYNGDTYEKEVVYDTEQLIKDFIKAMEGGDE